MKIHTGDFVIVISGKDRGKTGEVLRILPQADRVVVAGINMRTKHIRKNPQRAGQIIKYEASIHVSNVMVQDPKTQKPTRIGFVVDEKGKRRIAKRSGETIIGAAKGKGEKKQAANRGKADAAEKEKDAGKAAEKVSKPGKQPFWKSLGFGAQALGDAGEVKEEPRMKRDQSVPDQVQLPDTKAHQRGG